MLYETGGQPKRNLLEIGMAVGIKKAPAFRLNDQLSTTYNDESETENNSGYISLFSIQFFVFTFAKFAINSLCDINGNLG